MARYNDDYLLRTRQAREDEANKKLNLSMRGREKVFTDWEVEIPRDVEQREAEPSYQNMTAPTTNPDRPRALKLAYSREARKLVVKFRDGTWWEYNEVPVDMWNDLKSSDSTGKYLKYSGLDSHDDMGPFNPSEMPPETRVLFNS
jgi:hypothetical protein